MRKRGFEISKGFEGNSINLPKRSTVNSAGYDFECAEDIIIPSYFKLLFNMLKSGSENTLKPSIIKTGVKAYMETDEVLYLYNRSSNPFKKGIVMANSVGVVDSDYYGNPDNDGHIMFAFYNFLPFDIEIKKGEKIGQGVFAKYLKADSDNGTEQAAEIRKGGFGSTGE